MWQYNSFNKSLRAERFGRASPSCVEVSGSFLFSTLLEQRMPRGKENCLNGYNCLHTYMMFAL